jgi:hypothetical protein
MEFAIPLSRFDPVNVRWATPRPGASKQTVGFLYEDTTLRATSLILVLEPLEVVFIDWEKKQINLKESEAHMSFLSKVNQFQKIVHSAIVKHAKEWIGEELLIPNAPVITQPLLKSGIVTLYLSSDPSVLTFTTSSGIKAISQETLKPGDLIRVVVKLYGASLQMSDANMWTGRSRIQHTILQIYKVS